MEDATRNAVHLLLENKVAIVTGAAKGIGQGIAIEMAKEGATVVIADIDAEGSSTTQELILHSGGRALTIPTDVSDRAQNEGLVDAVLERFDRIDILVNNAGINAETGLLDMRSEEGLKVLNINFIGPFFLTQRVAQEMIKRKTRGSILFTSSIHGKITQLHPTYTATKAAIEMCVRDIALELSDYGIRVNAVAPGAIAVRGETDRSHTYIPFGYRGTPGDVANAMIFLASEKASYITGQTLVVDGGLSLAHAFYWVEKGILKP